jgi:hypothetical protein
MLKLEGVQLRGLTAGKILIAISQSVYRLRA